MSSCLNKQTRDSELRNKSEAQQAAAITYGVVNSLKNKEVARAYDTCYKPVNKEAGAAMVIKERAGGTALVVMRGELRFHQLSIHHAEHGLVVDQIRAHASRLR